MGVRADMEAVTSASYVSPGSGLPSQVKGRPRSFPGDKDPQRGAFVMSPVLDGIEASRFSLFCSFVEHFELL
jgi:hypothetical protein